MAEAWAVAEAAWAVAEAWAVGSMVEAEDWEMAEAVSDAAAGGAAQMAASTAKAREGEVVVVGLHRSTEYCWSKRESSPS